MKRISRFLAFCIFVLCLTTSTVWATPVSVSFTNFGTLSGATFGGSGIPNNAVAITTVVDGANTITLGLTATQRYANPALTNNGAGVFTASPGGDVLDGQPSYAMWNFDYYVNSTGGNYLFDLLYDFDPAFGTDQSAMGRIPFSSSGAVTAQDSWNLGMSFLSTNAFGTAPTFLPFNPGAQGEYSFALAVKNGSGTELGRSAIQVDVGRPVAAPEPSTLLLLGTGLLGIAVVQRKKTRS